MYFDLVKAAETITDNKEKAEMLAHIAYSIYKKNKTEYYEIIKFDKDSTTKIAEYSRSQRGKNAIEGYMASSQIILARYYDIVSTQIKGECMEEFKKMQKHKYVPNIISGMIATFLMMLISSGFYIFAIFKDYTVIDFKKDVKEIFPSSHSQRPN